MQVLVVSSPIAVDNEAGIVNDLFDAGLERFHLKKPGSTEEDVMKLVEGIRPEFRNRLVLHQHHGLAERLGTRRLHFPEHMRKEMKPGDWKTLAEKGFMLSSSIHNMADYETLPGQIEYVLYGPVFESISKPGYKPAPGKLPELTNKSRIRIIAIGGINPGNIDSVKAHHFDGAALLGVVWTEPAKAVSIFKSCLDKSH